MAKSTPKGNFSKAAGTKTSAAKKVSAKKATSSSNAWRAYVGQSNTSYRNFTAADIPN